MRNFWLASFPRSGNTWLRFLLYNYFFGEPSHSSDVFTRIPDIHVKAQVDAAFDFAQRNNVTWMFIKTHFPLSQKHPLLRTTAGFVYLLRHPRDILLSLIPYHALTQKEADWFSRAFIAEGGTDPVVPKWGSWIAHVQSWMNSQPKVVLRYDRMRNDAQGSLRSILELLGEEFDDERAKRAVAASSFDAMRAIESQEMEQGRESGMFDINPTRPRQGRRFVNAGTVGGTLSHIAPDLDELFDRRFGAAIQTWGLDQPA